MENLYTVNTYNYNKIQNLPCLHDTRSNKGSKKAKGYKNCMCAFDIETTRLEDIEQSIMYIWQFSILFLDDLHIDTIIGRTWTEFELFLDQLMNDDNYAYYMIFVHNLSYEFQFLRGIYTFSPDEVFAIKSRKILKCEMLERFEFRCSYLQTNMGLDSFTKKMKVEHVKLSGEIFDYSKKRYPWTPLTDYELQYSVNDTVGLLEAMYKRMILANDNLYTLPLTSTGYVRRETKKAMYGWARKHRDIFPTIDVFDLLEEAFRGGDTHANRYYSGTVIRADGKKILGIGSYDRSSSYPDVVENCVFPMTRFVFIGSITENDIEKKLDRGKALLFRCKITGLEQIDKYYGAPYVSFSKCRNVSRETLDNGRILSAEYIETTLTDIDYEIMKQEYKWENFEITECYESKYGSLPEPLKDIFRRYYTDKTELKGIAEQELFYNLQKALLNAGYGMMVQSPVKQSLIFTESSENIYTVDENVSRETLLTKYNRTAFLPYQWGVWVTAWARLRLKEGINIVGDRYLYSDTDSVKYVKVYGDDIDKRFDEYNKQRKEDSILNKAYATDKHGVIHHMGVFEYEDTYTEFSTLGAKKYVYRTDDGILHATIAGVDKKSAPSELEEHGGITAFKTGFTFSKSGGTESVYNDTAYGDYIIDGHTLHITQNVVIRPSTYTIGITDEYRRILADARTLKEFKETFDKN
jgi:hypothetical protein